MYKFETSKNKFGVRKLGTKDKLIIAFVIFELMPYVSTFRRDTRGIGIAVVKNRNSC